MKIQVIVDKSVVYTRTVVVRDNEVVEFYLDANKHQDIQDKVVQGQIVKTVKNLKSVFVDFGEEKNGLLPMSQIPSESLRTEGARIPVQVVREQHGTKGHKLTGYINITGKYLVCMPFEKEVVVSRKIKNETIRVDLKKAIDALAEGRYGFIVRTNAENATIEALEEDAKELIRLADELMATRHNVAKGTVYFEKLPLCLQVLRDTRTSDDIIEIISNDEECIKLANQYKGSYCLDDNIKITLASPKQDLFYTYDVEKHIKNLFKKNIWLKNGGNIVIEPTEAMTVVDVNSAKAVVSKNHRKSLLELNKLAVLEASKQIRLRNLSGMIIMDLVDMKAKEDQLELYDFAKKVLTQYDSRTKVYPLTPLSLLQIARTKKYVSLYDKVYTRCKCCDMKYGEYTLEYLSFLIEEKIRFIFYHTVNTKVYVKCQSELYKYLQEENIIREFEEYYNIEIELMILEDSSEKKFFVNYHI